MVTLKNDSSDCIIFLYQNIEIITHNLEKLPTLVWKRRPPRSAPNRLVWAF